MKFFKKTALLIAFISINNINALTNREKIELYNIINIIEIQPNKILTLPQKNILKKYVAMDKDPFVQEKIRYLTDHLKFNIDSLKEPVPTKQIIVQQHTTTVQKTVPQPVQQPQASQIPIEQKKEPLPIIPQKGTITPVSTKSVPTPQAIPISTKTSETTRPTNEDLIKQFAQMETAMYSNLYYNSKEGLLTLDGIEYIITTIKKDNPHLNDAALIDAAYKKAASILTEIKKQTTLDTKSATALKEMIKSSIGQTTIAPLFTPTLTELKTQPLVEYHETSPTSFTSTITSVIENIDKPIEQKKSPQALSDTLKKFVEFSRKKGTQYYSSKGIVNENWLISAVKLIVNGTLTANKKESVKQQLLTMIDILMLTPLRKDTSIPKNEYTKIATKLKSQITTFVDKLAVDTEYKTKK